MTPYPKLKTLVLSSVLILIGILGFFITKTYFSKQKHAEEIKKMPSINFITMHNKPFTEKDIPSGIPLIINYYNPSCDHCQYEARELKNRMEEFKNIFIVMVSAESMDSIAAFGIRYGLSSESNLRLLHDSKGEFRKIFGSVIVPSFFLYDKNHQLIRKFEGETKMDALVKCIKQ